MELASSQSSAAEPVDVSSLPGSSDSTQTSAPSASANTNSQVSTGTQLSDLTLDAPRALSSVAPASSSVFHSWGSAAREEVALPRRADGGSVAELRIPRRLSSRSRAAAASLLPVSLPVREREDLRVMWGTEWVLNGVSSSMLYQSSSQAAACTD